MTQMKRTKYRGKSSKLVWSLTEGEQRLTEGEQPKIVKKRLEQDEMGRSGKKKLDCTKRVKRRSPR